MVYKTTASLHPNSEGNEESQEAGKGRWKGGRREG